MSAAPFTGLVADTTLAYTYRSSCATPPDPAARDSAAAAAASPGEPKRRRILLSRIAHVSPATRGRSGRAASNLASRGRTTAPGSPLARAAAVSDAQRALVGQSFALPPDATSWKVADVFYSVEEGIDGVVVQYHDGGRDAPTDADVDAFEWAAHDDFVAKAVLDGGAAGRAARGRSPRKRDADDAPPKAAEESPRKRRR